jgi:hypothetical protein
MIAENTRLSADDTASDKLGTQVYICKSTRRALYFAARCGAIAQLGERLHGMQEVSGSIPLSSTT